MNPPNGKADNGPARWRVLDRRVIYSAEPWIELAVQRVQLPDGKLVSDYHELRLQEYSIVYASTPENRILIFRQYRHGVGDVTLALPAGFINNGEQPLEAAQRELLEETGYQAEGWVALGAFVPNSNYGCGMAHLFRAENAVKVAEPCSGDLEDGEMLLLTRSELLDALRNGEIRTLGMAAAVSLATHPEYPNNFHRKTIS